MESVMKELLGLLNDVRSLRATSLDFLQILQRRFNVIALLGLESKTIVRLRRGITCCSNANLFGSLLPNSEEAPIFWF